MKRSASLLLLAGASVTLLGGESPHILRASFPDGTGLEIFTETTGSSRIDFAGSMGIGPGVGSQDLVNRIVMDRESKILFVYNLEASRGTAPGTATIRIMPVSPETEASILKYQASRGSPYPGAHLPTVARIREFPSIRIGEALALDILYNPSTGEKIFDVLRPISVPSSGMSVTAVPAAETISLKDVAIRVNGRAMSAPASLVIGSAVRIDIPRHGTYIVAAYDPRESVPGHPFAALARADGKTLDWAVEGDRVNITSSTNVLTLSGKGALWLYHDTHYHPDIVGLQSADAVEWLLPGR